tara:strand:- start:2286 stop:2480 length:195 start_codon:yes stop_codon:yes gene_type:complete
MKKLTTFKDFADVIKNSQYLLSINKEEAEVLVQVVNDFQNKDVDNAPQTKSLLNAITELKEHLS